MSDFAFEVNIVAVVRVRAADENVALKVVPTVLGAPANENNAALGHHATISNVDFSVEDGSITLFEIDGGLCSVNSDHSLSPTARISSESHRIAGSRGSTPK